jgi:hypothetical protein
MNMGIEPARHWATNRNGFVMPVVILAIVVLGTLTVAALTTATDEVRSSRAMRESSTALYAAEAGANLLLATVVDSPSTVLDTLAHNMNPGDSVDFGWSTLPNGAAYRGVLFKYGVQAYALNVTGRDAGPSPAEQSIGYAMAPATRITLGASDAHIRNSAVSGLDSIPPQWDAAGCPAESDVAGIRWWQVIDTSSPGDVHLAWGHTLWGAPPVLADNTIDPFTWGSLDYDDLVNSATITLAGDWDITVSPTVSSGNCVDGNNNWGDPLDAASPCAERFPIIHVTGNLTLHGYGQGVLLVEGRLDIEDDAEFYGLIAGKDKIYVYDDARAFGGIVGADRIHLHEADGVFYSSCALFRATASIPGNLVMQPLDSRPWSAFLR